MQSVCANYICNETSSKLVLCVCRKFVDSWPVLTLNKANRQQEAWSGGGGGAGEMGGEEQALPQPCFLHRKDIKKFVRYFIKSGLLFCNKTRVVYYLHV
jgi:hypothetical protein